MCMCQPQPTHTWLFWIRNWVPSSLRSQPQLQSFNSKKHLCTYDSHLTKAPLWPAIKIPQQQGNPDTGGLVLSPGCHSRESRTHAGLGPNPHMQSVFSPPCTNTRSATKKKENTEEEESQHITSMTNACSIKVRVRGLISYSG